MRFVLLACVQIDSFGTGSIDCHRCYKHVQDGDRFWKVPEIYIRGATIKYLRIPDDVLDMVKEEVKEVKLIALGQPIIFVV